MVLFADEVFEALEIPPPNLIFEIINCADIDDWNVKLPPYKNDLVGMIYIITSGR